ncbi:transporter substrate-binding domain-containing protein [Bacillus manliponensis]|uniref:transporter substrate-binding domain-containing protein n=1 Tax=Bacillus manliponensis TaxID=574376 RepID=UPI00351669B4
MKKVLCSIFALIIIISMFAACSKSETASSNEEKTLVMGTSADYKPYEYIDAKKSEEIIGFDIDVMNYIAKELGYKVQVKDMEFSGLLAALEAEKVDFVMAGLTPNKEREKNADFTDAYFVAKNVVITKKDANIQTLQDLQGKNVGVQTGSTQEERAKKLQKEVKFQLEGRDRIPELIQEVRAGRVEAIILEETVAKGYLQKEKELKKIEISEVAEEPGTVIALPKGSELTEEFNTVIKKMQENGEMEKLVNKWFGGGK